MNTLTIRHRGKQREFHLTKGGYDFDGKRLSISIETWAEDQESPYAANFSLVNYPVSDGTAGSLKKQFSGLRSQGSTL